MERLSVQTVLIAVLACSTVFAGTALAVGQIDSGGAGSSGDLGGSQAADPDELTSDESVSNLRLTFTAEDISRDGSTDQMQVILPDEVAEADLSVNGAVVERVDDGGGVSISSSASLVDGPDGDGVQDTIRFAVSPTGGGSVDVNARVDVSITAPNVTERTEYPVRAQVTDSDGSSAGPTRFATLVVAPERTPRPTTTTMGTTTMGMTDTGTATSATGGDTTTMPDTANDDSDDDGSADDGTTAVGGDDTTAGSGPGFTVGLTVLVALAVAVLARRRN